MYLFIFTVNISSCFFGYSKKNSTAFRLIYYLCSYELKRRYSHIRYHAHLGLWVIPGKLLQLRFGIVQTISLYVFMGCVGQQLMESQDVARNLERQNRKQQESRAHLRDLSCAQHKRTNTGINMCQHNEKKISREHNLHSSAKFIINTAQPAAGPSRVDCWGKCVPCQKGA